MSRLRETLSAYRYTPTPEEKRWGLSSSVKSKGLLGRTNRFIARVTKQKEVDIVGFWQGIGRLD